MYVPLSDDKHRFVRDSSKKRTGNPRQNSVPRQNLRIFSGKFFFCDKKILCFYLRLNLSRTKFCLGLNFVSDYIPQLYFISNHLIYYYCLLTAVRIYRLVISIDLSETAHFAHWKSKTMSETNFFNDNFFSRQNFFSEKIFFSD